MSNEGWKTDGNCEECRKKQYCKKSCKKHKDLINDYLMETFRKKLAEQVAKDKEAGLLDDVCDTEQQDGVLLDNPALRELQETVEFVGSALPEGNKYSTEAL